METKVLRYSVIIKKEGNYYVAYVPTLGISDFGKTVNEAKKNVKGAIECHIEGLVKTDDDIPAPDGLDFYISQTEIIVNKNIKLAF